MELNVIHACDCLEGMKGLPENSIDSIVTDPPYGLSFMGKNWDHGVPGAHFWQEALRIAKPGAHLLAFGGTRTFHRLAVAIEDAGWEIRDCVMWVYGSGFPKSHNVGLSIDKLAGCPDRGHRIATASRHHPDGTLEPNGEELPAYEGKTEDGRRWQGWGTALKPAWEPVIVARKPLAGTVAANVLRHETWAINIDGCRVETADEIANHSRSAESAISKGRYGDSKAQETHQTPGQALGRWPANLIHDGSEEVTGLFPESSSGANPTRRGGMGYHGAEGQEEAFAPRGAETGSAARFFYCAKASAAEREEGLDSLEDRILARSTQAIAEAKRGNTIEEGAGAFNQARIRKNNHPTVKPIALMRYLVRLVTPPGGVVLDPFSGSGTTCIAAALEGHPFIAFEKEPEYAEICRARVAHWSGLSPSEFAAETAPVEEAKEEATLKGEPQLSLF